MDAAWFTLLIINHKSETVLVILTCVSFNIPVRAIIIKFA